MFNCSVAKILEDDVKDWNVLTEKKQNMVDECIVVL